MKISLLELSHDNYDVFLDRKSLYFNLSFIIVNFGGKWTEREMFSLFYNGGTIIVTLFFKEFVLRWNQ